MARPLTQAFGGPALVLTRQRAPSPALSMLAGGVLAVVVVLAHAWLMNTVGDGLAQLHEDTTLPPRVQVRYVREMALASPAEAAAPARPSAAAKAPQATGAPPPRPWPKASRVSPADDTAPSAAPDAAPPEVAQAASAPAAAPDILAPPDAQAAVSVAASVPTTGPTDVAPQTTLTPSAVDNLWPQTTRVSYVAQGYYGGEWHGGATVEWVRQGDRYQMNMDVSLGLGILKRLATSQGRITDQGAQPERFEESIHRAFSKPRKFVVLLGEQQIEFAQGNKTSRPANVQDTTSQFVQLTYLLASRPELREPGQRIEFPLAFHRNLRAYAYQVQGRTVLQTALGPLETVHVVPRRIEPKDNDLIAQVWFAPALQYLPARIRFSQGEDTYIELNISKAPELAR